MKKYYKNKCNKVNSQYQWGSRALMMSPAAVGKELFLCHDVLILMDCSQNQKGICCLGGRGFKGFVSRVGGVSHNLSSCLRVLEACRSCRTGRLQPSPQSE